MKALSLFSGIGGIDLACEWAGIETVAFCEREPFPQKVLRKHWPNIPIYDDVCTLTKERLKEDGIDCDTIGLISAGYPCQPESLAGKRKGKGDDRWLWPYVAELLEEIRPDWFLGENVAGHVTLGLDQVLDDLGAIGYTTQPFVIPACAIGAVHRRDRVFIIANSNGKRISSEKERGDNGEWQKNVQEWSNSQFESTHIHKNDSNSNGKQRQANIKDQVYWQPEIQGSKNHGSIEEWSERSMLFEPKLLRNYHGVPFGMERNRALGNAVVPQQIYPILAAIKQIDDALMV